MEIDTWFVTWDRPEYKEWARKNARGYDLVILRTEKKGKLLCVRARLIVRDTGLPEFAVDTQTYTVSRNEAERWINDAMRK